MSIVKVLMPVISSSITEASVGRWYKKEGDEVHKGETILEIETDKTTIEVEAPDSGILQQIIIPEGTEDVKINEILAFISKNDMVKGLATKTQKKVITKKTYIDIPISHTRKIIAKKVIESKSTIPHFYLSIDCAVDNLLKSKDISNKEISNDSEKISLSDLIIKACALSLKDVPEVNSNWNNTFIRQFYSSDISIAIDIKNGVVTPVIYSAEKKSIQEISKEMKTLIKLARKNKLNHENYKGGNFTISNLGMFDIKSFSAIINSPQSCILSVGKADKRPVIVDEKISIATIMNCTLSVDHRLIDGSTAAKFLKSFKSFIENPSLMI